MDEKQELRDGCKWKREAELIEAKEWLRDYVKMETQFILERRVQVYESER